MEIDEDKMKVDNEVEGENIIEENAIKNTETEEGRENPSQSKKLQKKEKNNLIRLPFAKVKNIIKMDNDIKIGQKNGYFVLGKLTELFLQDLAENAYAICKNSKRKTISLDDIHTAIKRSEKFSFIDFQSIFHVQSITEAKQKNRNQSLQNPSREKPESKSRTKSQKKNSSTVNNMTLDSFF